MVSLPDGHRATIEKNPTSTGFVGGGFSMDSLEFLVWLAVNFPKDIACLRVVLYLMGTQEPGGRIRATQRQVAEALNLHRVHVNQAMGRLTKEHIVHMVERGVYQLNPQASLRGGTIKVEEPGRPANRTPVTKRVDQLDLIAELAEDPRVPEAFTQLALLARVPNKKTAEG
ncbi:MULTISPECIES: helix-turn-helix domain-containing protein [unclassified Streptomyces]|uniref:helix-turn-helix domain-containing protein n=1 Tax=unclassified Streptomyces TaxID=2593676 RepID=UPI003331175C